MYRNTILLAAVLVSSCAPCLYPHKPEVTDYCLEEPEDADFDQAEVIVKPKVTPTPTVKPTPKGGK